MTEQVKRTNAAIMFSDIVGYTALMGEDENLAFQLVKKNSKLHEEVVSSLKGKVIKELGDGVLCCFPSAKEAVEASYRLQKHYFQTKELSLRIGIHFGEFIEDQRDVFGDAVNIASRLQALGNPGSVLVSKPIHDDLQADEKYQFAKLGPFLLKNVKEPLEIYALANEGLSVPKRGEMLKLLESRLKRFMIATLIFLILFLSGFWIYHNSYIKKLTETPEKSIAVLPFQNINNTEEDYFIDGLTLDIITQLSKIGSLRVISFDGSRAFKNHMKPLPEIGKELQVNYILEGNIQHQGDQIKIRTFLIEADKNKTIWSETYEMEVSDLFQIQSLMAKGIANKLSAALTEQERRQLEKRPTQNMTAYQVYLKGRELYYRYDSLSNQKAIEEFRNALKIDPKFPMAMTGLADAFSQNAGRFNMGLDWLDSSFAISQKAIALDQNLPDIYNAIGIANYYKDEYDKAIEAFQKAASINPNHPATIGNLATSYQVTGQLDKALYYQKIAAGLRPNSFVPYQIVGWTYRLLKDYDEAERWLLKSLEIQSFRDTYEQLAYTHLAKGEPEKAKAIIPLILSLSDGDSEKAFETAGIIAFYLSEFEQAKDYFLQALELNPKQGNDIKAVSPIYLAFIEKVNGDEFNAELLLNRTIYLYENEIRDDSQDMDIFFQMAMLQAIIGRNQTSFDYIKEAQKRNWIDVFKVHNNPIFTTLLNDSEFLIYIFVLEQNLETMKSMSMAKL